MPSGYLDDAPVVATEPMAAPEQHRRLKVVMLLATDDQFDSRVRRAAAALAAGGHDVRLLSKQNKRAPQPSEEEFDGVRIQRVLYRRLKFPILNGLPMTRRLDRVGKSIVKQFNPDIIHAHDLVALRIAARLARSVNARIVYDCHEYFADLAAKRGEINQRYIDWLEGRYIRHASAVITVSDGIAQLLSRRYEIEQPLVVYNSSDPLTLDPATPRLPSLRADLKLGDEDRLAVYVGSRNPHYGLENLVAALARTTDLHLALVGHEAPGYDADLKRRASQHGLDERVHILPPVPHDQLTGYIASADFGVIPIVDTALSLRHCMPNKLFQTTMAGIPFAYSDLPDMRRFAEKTGMGRPFNPTDLDEAAATLSWLRDNARDLKPSKERLQAIGREHGWAAEADKLARLYRRLAATEQGNSDLKTSRKRWNS